MVRPSANRICMYVPSADGGHAQYALELMTALADLPEGGDRCELVSSRDLDPRFRTNRYPVHAILPPLRHRATFRSRAAWVAGRLLHYPRREWQFLRWLRARPDVACVHFQEWVPWLAAPLFRRIRRAGKRVFYTVHNVVPHRYPPGVPPALAHAWIRRSCRACDGLFVHSDLLAEQLSRFLGGSHPPIRVVPHGVWTVPDAAAGPPADERLAWRRLLFFGTIRRNKGLDLLLRALEHLPGYGLTIAGEPVDRGYFDAEVLPRVRQLRAAGADVELIDRFTPDEEVGPLFARHSAIVLPYTPGFVAQSGVVFLAIAHGLPVVASEAGGLRDLLKQFRIGTTFHDPTPETLAAAVRALWADEERREGLAGEMRAARERFSWRAAAAATAAGYAAAMDTTTATATATTTVTAAAPTSSRREGGSEAHARIVRTIPVR